MFAILAMLLATSAGASADPCQALLPAALTRQLEAENTLHRIPRAGDATCPLLKRKHACLLATAGDFNGDGQQDYAVIMPFQKGAGPPRFLVAFGDGGGWKLHQITVVHLQTIDRFIISTLPPGPYRETAAVLPSGVTGRSLRTKTDGIMLESCGTTSTGLFYLGDGWFTLTLSD